MYEVKGIAFGTHSTYRKSATLVVCAETEDEVRLVIARDFIVRFEIISMKPVVGEIYYVGEEKK